MGVTIFLSKTVLNLILIPILILSIIFALSFMFMVHFQYKGYRHFEFVYSLSYSFLGILWCDHVTLACECHRIVLSASDSSVYWDIISGEHVRPSYSLPQGRCSSDSWTWYNYRVSLLINNNSNNCCLLNYEMTYMPYC